MAPTHHGGKRRYAVRGEITKQLGVVSLITAIGVWQHHFVIQAASADIYIFALLFGAGLFGMYDAIVGTHRLANEFVALEAMKEIYEDARRYGASPEEARAVQRRRVGQPAIVYGAPWVLATAHNLIVEEVQRNGSFRIPMATMQVLVTDLETKLDDRQGMGHYLGALLVLLGLLGTFIGLMHTLESVGGILGSMDLSGSGGAGAIAGLIESLKKPLDGMATGFGASLFGLIGSLIVGFLGKVDGKAAFRLKHEFETWIRSTVQIEASEQERKADALATADLTSAGAQVSASDLHALTILRVARSTVAATSRMAEQVTSLTAMIALTHGEIAAQRSLLERIADTADQASAAQASRDRELLSTNGHLTVVQSRLTAAVERLMESTDAHFRAAELALEGRRGDEDAARDVLDRSTDGLRAVKTQIASLEASLAASRGAPEPQPVLAVGANEVSELVAELDRLIASSSLDPQDVRRLRRLSSHAQKQFGSSRTDHSETDMPARVDETAIASQKRQGM